MTRRIPSDAFEYYVSLGEDRSYQKVAQEFEFSKRAIQNCAHRENWARRLEKIERESRERVDRRLGETLDDIRERHLKTLRAMNGRALEALRTFPISSGMDAIRAAEAVIKLERLVCGEVTDRSAVCVEDVIKREFARWMDDGEGDDDDECDDEPEEESDGAGLQ